MVGLSLPAYVLSALLPHLVVFLCCQQVFIVDASIFDFLL